MVALSHESDHESVYKTRKLKMHKIHINSKGTPLKNDPCNAEVITHELRFGLSFRINAERVHRHRP